jgi:hypothetical protein
MDSSRPRLRPALHLQRAKRRIYQIPDRILDKLGFNTTSEPFSVEPGAGGDEENGEQEDAA